MTALTRIVAPTIWPVSLQTAKDHARIEYHEDDELIELYIKQVTALCESRTQRALLTQTWELSLDAFPCARGWVNGTRAYEIRLPNPPLASVTSIKYDDGDNVEQTLATTEYVVDSASEPGRVIPAYGKTWPSVYPEPNSVRIRYVCGYASAASVPVELRSWILARIATFTAFREQISERQTVELPRDYVDGLLDPYRVYCDVP